MQRAAKYLYRATIPIVGVCFLGKDASLRFV